MSTLGLYAPGRSWLHRLRPGAKLLGLLVVLSAVLRLRTPTDIGWGALGTAALVASGWLPRHVLLRTLRPLLWLCLAVGALQLLVAGWEQAVVVTGRLALGVLLASLVTLTTRVADMVDTVVWLLGPLRAVRVDPQRVGLLLALGIRSVPVVAGLGREVREAQLARGLGSDVRAYGVPLVVRSLRHADRLGEALAARGLDD